jgi:hypothetical protein
MIGGTTCEWLNGGFWVLEGDMVEIEGKRRSGKVTHKEVVPGQRRIEGFKTSTTRRGQWNTFQGFGAMRVENDVAEEGMALT